MGVRLSMTDIEDFKKQGYSEYEIQSAIKELESEELTNSYTQVQKRQNYNPMQNSQMSAFAIKADDNLIRWQLELNDILERAEHILKGDVPTFEENQVIWKPNPFPEDNPMNIVGVQEIMKILAMYVNRNTILSDYSNEEINIKVYDFGREVNNLIFMRYDDFGMNNEEKKKNYPILVREIVDIVHSAYKRALDGAEKRSLREMINVSQNTSTSAQLNPNGMTINNGGVTPRERGLLNPMRIIKGKYL
jgi:hypothetical protein